MRRATLWLRKARAPRTHHRRKTSPNMGASSGHPRRARTAGPTWTLGGTIELFTSLAVVLASGLFLFGWLAQTTVLATYVGPMVFVSLVVLVLTMLVSARGSAGGCGNALGRHGIFRR